ncbi:MAG: enoyl-CoA hydratase/isomerase family protein [Anaerolineales bacterium]|nr:enoyl-CoA hydratase/isomerase family protein [Anaerolineales bacterium]
MDKVEGLQFAQSGAILRIQFDRPAKKNALTPAMYDGVSDLLQLADQDPGIRVVYLTGSGDSFTAGNDLTTFRQNPDNLAGHRFITTISTTATPIVAAVNGLAVGVGVTMLLHCDLVFAASRATFDFAFVDLGLVPEAGSSYLLPRLAGPRRAAELLMLGEKFDVDKAYEIGLVNSAHPPAALHVVAWQAANRLAAKPPEALRHTKALLKRGIAATVAETIEVESTMFRERLHSEEVRRILSGWPGGGAANADQ